MSKDLVPGPKTGPAQQREPSADNTPKVGQWYWVKGNRAEDKDVPWFGCVTHNTPN